MSDNCACNYGDDGKKINKLNCWAKLKPKDPNDPTKGFQECSEMPPGDDDCNDYAGPDGMTCHTAGGVKNPDGTWKSGGKCVAHARIPKNFGLKGKKCVDPFGWKQGDPEKCNLWGMGGSDCRACNFDGDDKNPLAFPGNIESRCKPPSKPSKPSGGGGSSDAADAGAVAAAKQALAPFEILAAVTAAKVLNPVICGPLENAIASSDDGDAKPMVQALVSLLGCDSSTPAPSPSPSPTQSS